MCMELDLLRIQTCILIRIIRNQCFSQIWSELPSYGRSEMTSRIGWVELTTHYWKTYSAIQRAGLTVVEKDCDHDL